jgi:DHA1 family bicyclomycin/chloramphenicol resistance-like MFS transporter
MSSTPANIPTSKASPDWRFMATLAAITLIGPLAVHAFLPVMPTIKTVFGVSDALAGMGFTLGLLVMAFATLVYGSLSDRYGRRPVLLGGLTLFVIGCVLASFAESFAGLLAGRMLQALGAGCSITLARAVARDAYGAEVLVKVIAYLTMAYTLGPMLSPYITGLIVDSAGWRAAFWFMAIAGSIILLVSWLILVETHPREARQPKGGNYLHDYLKLFSHLRFAAYVLQSGFSSGCFYTMAAASAFLMTGYLGRSASEFGSYFALFPLGFFLGNLVSSRLSGRVSIETMVFIGGALNFLAITGQSIIILSGHLSPLVLFIPGALITFGQGLALPNATSGAMRVIPSLSGTASGIGVFCQTFIGAMCAQIYSTLSDGTPLSMVWVVSFCSVMTLAAGCIPWLMKRRGQ